MTRTLILLITLPLSTLSAAEWGTLRGQFVFEGDVPKREPLALNKDVEFCSKHSPLSQELIVDGKTRGVANVVVWIDEKASGRTPEAHPSYAATAKAQVLFDNDGCVFHPRVAVVRSSQTLVIRNQDDITHNVAAVFSRNRSFNIALEKGGTEQKTFGRAETKPAKVLCPIHSWMTGYVFVKDHPYVAVTDQTGAFEIKNVPAGEWTVRVWHERPTYIVSTQRNGKPESWDKGRSSFTVKSGINEFGTIRLNAESLKRK